MATDWDPVLEYMPRGGDIVQRAESCGQDYKRGAQLVLSGEKNAGALLVRGVLQRFEAIHEDFAGLAPPSICQPLHEIIASMLTDYVNGTKIFVRGQAEDNGHLMLEGNAIVDRGSEAGIRAIEEVRRLKREFDRSQQ